MKLGSEAGEVGLEKGMRGEGAVGVAGPGEVADWEGDVVDATLDGGVDGEWEDRVSIVGFKLVERSNVAGAADFSDAAHEIVPCLDVLVLGHCG